MNQPARRSVFLATLMPRNGDTGRIAAARALAYLFAAAGAIGATYQIAALHSGIASGFNVMLVGNAFALAVLCALTSERISLLLLELILGVGSVLVTGAVVAGPHEATAIAFFYLWVCLFAFYYFPFAHGLGHLAFVGALYGSALFWIHPRPDAVNQWVITLGTLCAVGPLVSLVKKHVEELIAHLSEAATTDPLTKLLNRRGLEDVFAMEIERARRGSGRLSLLVGDLDYFKQVNDGYGHGRGDEVLRSVAHIFSESTRQIDTAARIGGEEFTILLPETDADGAYFLAEKLRKRVQEAFQRDPVKLTISFGVASFGVDGSRAEDMLRAGDHALYVAKELGRNRCVQHSDAVEEILEQASRHREAQSRTHLATLLTLAEALDMRDENTGSHSLTVGRYAELMARELNMDEEQTERMRLAGVLHDVGKIGVPDSVLRKAGPLDDAEWELMRKHPEIGARMLGPTDFKDIQAWVVAHHERPDGRGYPHGLAGDEIPLGARVLSVADAYEAMTADRVYRTSIGHVAAREELVRCIGTHFDARVVRAFFTVLDREGIGSDELGATDADLQLLLADAA